MATDTQHWLKQIDEATSQYNTAFGSLSSRAINWKPATGKWSIAQCIDHVMTVNNTYKPIFTQLRKNSYSGGWMTKLPWLPSLTGRMLYGSLKPDRKYKTRTFAIWEPSSSDLDAQILEHFNRHQAELKADISGLAQLDFDKVVIASPASKMVTYTLSCAMDIIIVHELRHLEQGKEVLALLQSSVK